jgi:hypothetical protein
MATASTGYRNDSREMFSIFWKHYPRKLGKEAAVKAWIRLLPSAELLTRIVAALDWQTQLEEWTKNNGQFILHPTTWINQRRWTDERPTPGVCGPTNKRVHALVEGGRAFLDQESA